MKLRLKFTLLLLLLFNTFLLAQVSNDHARNAIKLVVDSSFHKSNTNSCTLEDSCLNRVLTAKCLVYHNDQWFTFFTTDASEYFLSIRNQNCRDVNGVQLLLIDGDLCHPSSYDLLECVSLATQDDIYLTLKNLKKNHQYIINLDGYLNDFCEFEINISTKLPSFAVIPLSDKGAIEATDRNSMSCFKWHLTEEMETLKIVEFEIDRRFQTDKKFNPITKLPVERFVHGKFKLDYEYCDTINRRGQYSYKVMGVTVEGQKYLLGEHGVFNIPIPPRRPTLNDFILELPCKNKTEITVSIFNLANQQLLDKISLRYSEGLVVALDPYFPVGVLKLHLKISGKDGQKIKEFIVDKKY